MVDTLLGTGAVRGTVVEESRGSLATRGVPKS